MHEINEAKLRDDPVDRLKALVSEHQGRTLNEADTRHRVIDFILHELLAWPRNRVSVEEYVAPGYADYVLKKTNGDPLIFVEAKREGIYFALPHSIKKDEQSAYIGVGKLLSDAAIKAAMNQV